MRIATLSLLAIAMLVAIGVSQDAPSDEPQKPMRIFLLSAKPSPEAWQFMKENPGDRRAATEDAMQRIGGKMLGYYWGLTTGTVDTHLEPSDESSGIYQVSLHCCEEKAIGDADTSVMVPRRWTHCVAKHPDRVHIEALADFLSDALGFTELHSDEPRGAELAGVTG